jgi:hypothetical protein
MCIHLSQYKNIITYCDIFEYCFMNTIKLFLHAPQQCPIQYFKVQFIPYFDIIQTMMKLKHQPPNFKNHLALILSHQKFQET